MALLNETQQDYYDGNDFGGYQFISLDDIINNFIISYVGENKIIPKVKRTDIAFHAQRAIQELSFDTFKSIKSQEITLPPSNTMVLPQDYVNYTKICWTDGSGVERPLYPTRHTSNPTPILQNSDGEYTLTAIGTLITGNIIIDLDAEYKDIEVGMSVSSPGIPDGAIVWHTYHTNGITSIIINDETGPLAGSLAAAPTYTGTETLTFTPLDRSLSVERTAHVLENVSWTQAENKITQSPNTDVSDIKVGMLVSNRAFPPGTVVTDVTGDVITTSVNAEESSVAQFNNSTTHDITFFDTVVTSTTWDSYSSTANSSDASAYNHDTDIYDLNLGQRYGLEPTLAQANGSYYIDNLKGLIHFSSNCSGKNIVLKYISDGLGTDAEMIVHKFAEEAMYKSIAYAIFSTTITGQNFVQRFKKEKFAAIRQAKLRLSNLKIEELAQIMRGKSKWIKH